MFYEVEKQSSVKSQPCFSGSREKNVNTKLMICDRHCDGVVIK
jgi:hypothetical protein